jgi:hypothetical protein
MSRATLGVALWVIATTVMLMQAPGATAVTPRFTCRDKINVVFVHVFKCAGSSLRKVFRVYGSLCGMSVATLTDCHENSPQAIARKNKGRLPCVLKDFNLPNRPELIDSAAYEIEGPHSSFIQTFNIVQGHVRYGMNGLKTAVRSPRSTLMPHSPAAEGSSGAYYVTWVRNPITMLVSASNFVLGKLKRYNEANVEEQFTMLFENLISRMTRTQHRYGTEKIYSMYASYYLTDANRAHLNTSTSQEITTMVKTNLNKFQVVGVLENHDISMILLRHLLDPREGIDANFWKSAASVDSNKGHQKGRVKIGTTEIMLRLKQKPLLWYKLLLFVKDEFEIYDYAVQRNIEQCEQFRTYDRFYFEMSVRVLKRSPTPETCRVFMSFPRNAGLMNFEVILEQARLGAEKYHIAAQEKAVDGHNGSAIMSTIA